MQLIHAPLPEPGLISAMPCSQANPVSSAIAIARASVADFAEIGALHEAVFGPGRFARTAFRVREMAPSDPALSLVARAEGRLIGAVLQSPVSVGAVPGAWLGPIAVTATGRRAGVGGQLMRAAAETARDSGAAFVLLVGDAPYYGRFGYVPVQPGRIKLPGPVDPARLLVLMLDDGAEPPAGAVTPA